MQDSEHYDSKHTQGGVSASVAIYGSGSSVSAQFSQNKAKVNYSQVNQQSGFNIGKSSDINVAEHTHLKGGIINAQGDKANHQMRTGSLTTEDITNRSEVKVSSVSAGASTDMSKMASSAMSAALSALGNMNERESSTTKSAISQHINLTITDDVTQKQKTGKSAEETLQALNRDVENANQQVAKQDLQKIQERQEAAQLVAEIGAKRVGDLAQAMGWEEGSPQKVALHGLVGYLSAKVGGGNTAASALSAMGSEYINTEIANYLKENTNLTADQRNAIQQASAAGIGAMIGAGLGGDSTATKQSAQVAVRTEQFNRQLHPDALDLIRENAKAYAEQRGIKEDEAIAELMQEGLRGVSDDAAHLIENKQARAYLNELQAKAQNKALFAILDRRSDEYKNSLINADAIGKNQDLYNSFKLDRVAMSTSEQLLAKRLKEGAKYHQQAGKGTVLSVYEDALQAVKNRQESANQLRQQIESDKAQAQAVQEEKTANSLNNMLSANYPNARGLFTQEEFLSPVNAYGKVATGAIAEGYGVIGLGKTAQVHLNGSIPKELSVIGINKNYENTIFIYRYDDNFYSTTNTKGKNKAHLNEHGDFGWFLGQEDYYATGVYMMD